MSLHRLASRLLGVGVLARPARTRFPMICSMSGSDQFYTVTAFKTGYNLAARQVLAGWDREVHFELTRR